MWSLQLDYEWGTDYGGYYLGSSLFSNEYGLYVNHLDHKGPVYYYFLYLIGNIIEFSPTNAILSLFFTLIFYNFVILYISSIHNSNIISLYIILLINFNSIVYLNTNSSIALFQVSFLILFLQHIFEYLHSSKESVLYISMLFLILSILTRIDSIMFAVLYLFVIRNNKSFLSLIKHLIVFILIYCTLLLYFGYVLHFDIYEYFNHNVLYNYYYKMSRDYDINYFKYIIVEKDHLSLFLLSGLPLLLVLYKKKNINKELNIVLFDVFLIILSYLVLCYTGGQDYHVLIFLIPIMFICIKEIDRARKHERIILFICVLLLSINNLYHSKLEPIYSLSFDYRDKYGNMYATNDKGLLGDFKNIGNGYGFFNRQWIYLFSKIEPKILNNPGIFFTNKMEKFHKYASGKDKIKDLVKKKGEQFIIEKSYLNEKDNSFVQLIMQKTKYVIDSGQMYQIREVK